MDFSSPVPASRALVLALAGSGLVAVAHGNTLSVYSLESLVLLETYVLPAPPLYVSCTSQPPYVVAAASTDSVSVLSLRGDDDAQESVLANISMAHMPVSSLALTDKVLIAFHAYGLGASVFPLRGHRSGPLVPILLRHVMPPRGVLSPGCLPCTAALSPCKRFLATALKLPNGSPAVQVVALPDADIIAVATGTVALGGRITEVAGLLWLREPHSSLFVWGQPIDGPEAICLLSLDCALLQEGIPESTTASAEDSASPSFALTSSPPQGGHSTPSPLRRKQRRRRSSFVLPSPVLPSNSTGSDDVALDVYRDLGVKTASAVQGAPIVAVGGYDGTVRILNVLSWTLIASWNLEHPTVDPNYQPTVYIQREKLLPAEEAENRPPGMRDRRHMRPGIARASYFEAADCNEHIALPTRKQFGTGAAGDDDLLCCGVGLLHISADGRWLATRSDRLPCVVFIADIPHARLASVLVMSADVRSLSWSTATNVSERNDSKITRLAIATDGQFVSFWSEAGVAIVQVPDVKDKDSDGRGRTVASTRGNTKPFLARRVVWNDGNDTLLALDTGAAGSFSVIYMQ